MNTLTIGYAGGNLTINDSSVTLWGVYNASAINGSAKNGTILLIFSECPSDISRATFIPDKTGGFSVAGPNWPLNATDFCYIEGLNITIGNWTLYSSGSGSVTIVNSNITYANKTFTTIVGDVQLIYGKNTVFVRRP